MSQVQLDALLAEQVMGWGVGPDRFTTGGRCWMPRWKFQPTVRIEDAIRLRDRAAPQEYSVGAVDGGEFWARVRIGGATGEAREPSEARAVTFAIARALGIDVESCE